MSDLMPDLPQPPSLPGSQRPYEVPAPPPFLGDQLPQVNGEEPVVAAEPGAQGIEDMDTLLAGLPKPPTYPDVRRSYESPVPPPTFIGDQLPKTTSPTESAVTAEPDAPKTPEAGVNSLPTIAERLSPEELAAAETIASNPNIPFGLHYWSPETINGVRGNTQRSPRLDPLEGLSAELQQAFRSTEGRTDQGFGPGTDIGRATDGMYARIQFDKGRALAWKIIREEGSVHTLLVMDPAGGGRPGINFSFVLPNAMGLGREAAAIDRNPDVLIGIFAKAFPDRRMKIGSEEHGGSQLRTTAQIADGVRTPEVLSPHIVATVFSVRPVVAPNVQPPQTEPKKRGWFRGR